MKRREFLKLTSALGFAAISPLTIRSARAEAYTGLVFINVIASGGWDVATFCDPKQDPAINTWAANGQTIQRAGNISYAPFADNEAFFNTHYRKMLVINGIDHLTNSHSAGQRNSAIGRMQAGYPSISALHAALNGSGLPMPYIAHGNYDATANLVTTTKVPSNTVLDTVTQVNQRTSTSTIIPQAAYERIQAAQLSRMQGLRGNSTDLPRTSLQIDNLYLSHTNSDLLDSFSTLYQAQKAADAIGDGYRGKESRAHIALIAAAAGLTTSVTIASGGFDTHDDHDNRQATALSELTGLIDSIWRKATELGISNRLVMLVNSDFGRRPSYNDGAGKDHWAIGSALIMKENESWTNQVVGATDEGLKARPLNASTLQPNENGVVIEPKHVHATVRDLLGLSGQSLTQQYPLLADDIKLV